MCPHSTTQATPTPARRRTRAQGCPATSTLPRRRQRTGATRRTAPLICRWPSGRARRQRASGSVTAATSLSQTAPRQDAAGARAPRDRALQRSRRPRPRPDVRDRHDARRGDPPRPPRVGTELEPRWASLARANLEHAQQGRTRQRRIVEGDARHLPRLLATHAPTAYRRVDLILTSPPYACQVADVSKAGLVGGVGLGAKDTRNYSADKQPRPRPRTHYLEAMAGVYAASPPCSSRAAPRPRHQGHPLRRQTAQPQRRHVALCQTSACATGSTSSPCTPRSATASSCCDRRSGNAARPQGARARRTRPARRPRGRSRLPQTRHARSMSPQPTEDPLKMAPARQIGQAKEGRRPCNQAAPAAPCCQTLEITARVWSDERR